MGRKITEETGDIKQNDAKQDPHNIIISPEKWMSDVSYWCVEGIILKTDKRIAVNHKNGVTLASQPCLFLWFREQGGAVNVNLLRQLTVLLTAVI